MMKPTKGEGRRRANGPGQEVVSGAMCQVPCVRCQEGGGGQSARGLAQKTLSRYRACILLRAVLGCRTNGLARAARGPCGRPLEIGEATKRFPPFLDGRRSAPSLPGTIRVNPTESDRIRPNPTESDRIRPEKFGREGPGESCLVKASPAQSGLKNKITNENH
jgi:hypothetical protein